MRMRVIAAIVVGTAAWAALAQPVYAAGPRTYRQPASDSVLLTGHATNGFRFYFFAFGPYEALLLDKELPNEGDENVTYVARHRPSRLDQGRLDLRIGRSGHLRGHLVATETDVRKPEEDCKGRVATTRTGHFVGSFVLRGERGYATLHTRRMFGTISHIPARECSYPKNEATKNRGPSQKASERLEKARERDEIRLLAGDPKGDLLFRAGREQAPPELGAPAATSYEVTSKGQDVGSFEVRRTLSTYAKGLVAAEKYFAVPDLAHPMTEATLEPPAPFSGSATFRLEGPRKAAWTGDLSVELPGAGTVPLSGKKIYAGVCKGSRNCTATLPPLLARSAIEAPGLRDGGEFTVGIARTNP